MHGGLSPELSQMEQIANIARPCDVPDTGLLCDILWSDPDPSITVGLLYSLIIVPSLVSSYSISFVLEYPSLTCVVALHFALGMG